ncbi:MULTISPECIES: hypothetical protein [Methylobacterium]|uniref:Uncharacterized protein n=2 Tax=Methylobacterium TaxID=407 RepID=A0A0C6FV52_9HYPH|nr:hypothetical protein [Methylobacterium aquaticum]BAQ49464.1 hypothetical protein Maq22A_1p36270 [Methylobacterium aquaticum]
MPEIEVPCPTCSGTANMTPGGGRNNLKDRCTTCGGRRTILARPGESRETSWPFAVLGAEPAEEKIARLTRERDETATQAAACGEEVDRVRVEIGAVQAENERLKADAEGWRSLWFEANRATSAWAYQSCKDKITLAESERKRVATITPEQAALLARMLEPLARADRAIGEESGPFRFETATGYRDLAREDLRSAGEAYRLLKASSTPTQETSHVEI